MTICRRLAQTIAAISVAVGGAVAQEKIVSERTKTQATGWWQYHNVTADQLKSYIDANNARIIDLDVNGASPLRFSAAMVANSGPHASGWWWYYGLTAAQVGARLDENSARLIDIDPYMDGGQLRFAVVMKPNAGADATGWWWYYEQTPQNLSARLNEHKARLIDLERYRDGGQTRYAAIMVSNAGAKATGWWWYYGQTAAEVKQRINDHDARLLDIERYGGGASQRFDIVLVPNAGAAAITLGDHHALGVADLDLIELNEAFASQSLVCIDELGLDPARVNVNGGAIALGHPLGMSGGRLITMLTHELRRTGGRYGLATMCIGVGQGIATIVERLDPDA